MIGRRAAGAGIATKLGNHSFRATGITAYLKNGGTLEKAAAMANHASTRTTQLYDRRRDEVSHALRCRDLTGPKPFCLLTPISPGCPEAVSPRALGVSQK